MKGNNSIKSWSEDERPRERMMQKGSAVLSNAELLAILIASGTREKSALDLAREVLAIADNNLNQLGKLNIKEFEKVKGIGKARAVTLLAALELGRRRRITESLERPAIISSTDASEILFPLLQDLHHEAFCVLYLDTANQLIKYEIISIGGLSATVADIRVILKNALLCNSSKILVAHNHPSGNPEPSGEDKRLTLRLKEAARFMDITVLDHIIIAGTKWTSMADEGWL